MIYCYTVIVILFTDILIYHNRQLQKNPPPQSHYGEVKNKEDAPPKPEQGIMRKDSQGNTISEDVDV